MKEVKYDPQANTTIAFDGQLVVVKQWDSFGWETSKEVYWGVKPVKEIGE